MTPKQVGCFFVGDNEVCAGQKVCPSPRASGFKGIWSASTFCLWPRHQPRQALQDSEKNKIYGVAVGQSNPIDFFFKGGLLCPTATINYWNFIFHTAFHACHAWCSSDVHGFFILFFKGVKLTQTKVLARLMSGPNTLRGGKGGRPCPLFVCAFWQHRLPRTPTRLCCAHSGTHSDLRLAKCISLLK